MTSWTLNLRRRSFIARGVIVAAAACILSSVAGAQQAIEPIRLRARVAGEWHEANVDRLRRDGIDYIDLAQLVEALNGGLRVLAGRVQVDFVRQTAWIRIGETTVDGSLERFQLYHPLVRINDRVIMAVSDVQPFFSKGFRVTVELAPQDAARPASETEKSRAVEVEELPQPGRALRRDEEVVVLPEERRVQTVVSRRGTDTPAPSKASASVSRVSRYSVKTVVIDPGHGGNDTGCEGRSGLREKDLALAVALLLEDHVKRKLPLNVVVTRRQDIPLTNEARANITGNHEGAIVVSLHAAAGYSDHARGIDMFYWGGRRVAAHGIEPDHNRNPTDSDSMSKGLGRLSAALVERIADNIEAQMSMPPHAIHEAPCTLLKAVTVPAVLIEIGYLSNASEEDLLNDNEYRDRLAEALAEGIAQFAAATPKTVQGGDAS